MGVKGLVERTSLLRVSVRGFIKGLIPGKLTSSEDILACLFQPCRVISWCNMYLNMIGQVAEELSLPRWGWTLFQNREKTREVKNSARKNLSSLGIKYVEHIYTCTVYYNLFSQTQLMYQVIEYIPCILFARCFIIKHLKDIQTHNYVVLS